MKTVNIEITGHEKLVDITPMVREYVSQMRIRDGFVQIQIPERTSAVTISVNDDWRLERELFEKINHLLPKYDGMKFTGWTTANVKASLFGMSLQVMIQEGTLILDKNQAIYFVEFQGPGERQFFMSAMGTTLGDNEAPRMPEALTALYQKRQAYEEEQQRIQEEMRNEWKLREQRLQQEKEQDLKTDE